jgi:hypothetical protein
LDLAHLEQIFSENFGLDDTAVSGGNEIKGQALQNTRQAFQNSFLNS